MMPVSVQHINDSPWCTIWYLSLYNSYDMTPASLVNT